MVPSRRRRSLIASCRIPISSPPTATCFCCLIKYREQKPCLRTLTVHLEATEQPRRWECAPARPLLRNTDILVFYVIYDKPFISSKNNMESAAYDLKSRSQSNEKEIDLAEMAGRTQSQEAGRDGSPKARAAYPPSFCMRLKDLPAHREIIEALESCFTRVRNSRFSAR